MGLIEKLLSGTISDRGTVQDLLGQTITTEHSRRILDGLTAQDAATAPARGAGTVGRDNTPPTAKTAHTAQEDGADRNAAQG